MRPIVLAAILAEATSALACHESAREAPSSSPPPAASSSSALRLGAPIEGATREAKLAALAAEPGRYEGAAVVTQGTIEAVCQHKGCWMELREEGGAAHVKMAGHAFFVPRGAKGKRAKVMGQLRGVVGESSSCAGEHGHAGGSCRGEAETQLGRPLAKLELVASGVEIYD